MNSHYSRIKNAFLYNPVQEYVLEQNAQRCRLLCFKNDAGLWRSEVLFEGDLSETAQWVQEHYLEYEGLYVYRNDSPSLLVPGQDEEELQVENLVPPVLTSASDHQIGIKGYSWDAPNGKIHVNLLYRSHDIFDFEYPPALASIQGLISFPVAFLRCAHVPETLRDAVILVKEQQLTDVFVWKDHHFAAYFQIPDSGEEGFTSDVYLLIQQYLPHSIEGFQPEMVFCTEACLDHVKQMLPEMEVQSVNQMLPKEKQVFADTKEESYRAKICLSFAWESNSSDYLLSAPGAILTKNQKLTQLSLSFRKLTAALSLGLLAMVLILMLAHVGMGFIYQSEIENRQQEIALNSEIDDLNIKIMQEHDEASQLLRQKTHDTQILNSMVKSLPKNCEIIQWQKKAGIHFVTGITENESALFQLVKDLKADNIAQKIKITGTEVVDLAKARRKYAKPQLLRFTLRFSL